MLRVIALSVPFYQVTSSNNRRDELPTTKQPGKRQIVIDDLSGI